MMENLNILFAIFISLFGTCENVSEKKNFELIRGCQNIHLEILVSPLIKNGMIRRLEVQWQNAPNNEGDWIGLFKSNSSRDTVRENYPEPLEIIPVTHFHGWANTSVLEDHVEPEELGFQEKCLDYHASYFDAFNNTLASACLRIEPNWMWNLRNEIGPRKLRTVFIPGTHDSAAYEEPDGNSRNTIVKKYSITQDESVLAQLIYGVRYIDLRVGYYPKNNEPWWANHGIVKIHPLRIILRDIRTFLNRTNEIVILDVQEFPIGFTSMEIHESLVNVLMKELGDLAVPPLDWDSTFDQVWKTGRRLIIGYDRKEVLERSNVLWKSVQQKWGNVQSVVNLHTYLAKLINRPPIAAWSAMAELTPTALDIILDRLKGLRVMAESVNHNVTEWFQRKEWQPKSNIVTVDFFRNTGIVSSAIEWNKNQGKC